MTFKKLTLPFLITVSIFAVSCDSSEIEKEEATDTAQANAIINTGDIFSFLSITGAEGFIDEVVFSSSNQAGSGQLTSFTYQKTGNHTAEIAFLTDTQTRLTNSLGQALSGALGASLANELRLLLSTFENPTGQFTAAQIARIVAILNISGSGLVIHPDDPTQILAANNRTYNLLITSTVLEKFRGSIGGIYNVVGVSSHVNFDPQILPNGQDNTELYIPFVSNTLTTAIELDRGRWSQELINVNTLP